MSITVTFFIAPNGEREVREITKVYDADAAFFKRHGVKISMEDVGSSHVVYADTGKITDGEPDELIEIAGNRSCADTLKALRMACQKRFDEEGRRPTVDNSSFPERKVSEVNTIAVTSVAYRLGSRLSLVLECGHVVGYKGDKAPASAKCMACHQQLGGSE